MATKSNYLISAEFESLHKCQLPPSCHCSVAQACLVLCDFMDCSTPGFLSFTISWSLLKLTSIQLVILSNYFILRHPLLLLPSIFPSIRVFSNHQVAKVLELQLQHQSFQWIFRVDFLYENMHIELNLNDISEAVPHLGCLKTGKSCHRLLLTKYEMGISKMEMCLCE